LDTIERLKEAIANNLGTWADLKEALQGEPTAAGKDAITRRILNVQRIIDAQVKLLKEAENE
jgi:hypothetical protein